MATFDDYLNAAGLLLLNDKQRAFHEAERAANRARLDVLDRLISHEAFEAATDRSVSLWVALTEDERAPFRKLALDMLDI